MSKLQNINKPTPNHYFKQGVEYHLQKNYKEAIKCYDQATKLNPKYIRAWNNKGAAHSALNEHEEATKCYNQAIKLPPASTQEWDYKGTAYRLLKRYKEAIECYDQAIKLDPEYTKAWNNKGAAHSALNEHKQAIQSFTKAVHISKNHTQICLDAIKACDAAIKSNPNDAEAHYNKGNLLQILNKEQDALDSFKDAYNKIKKPKLKELLLEIKMLQGASIEAQKTINNFNNLNIRVQEIVVTFIQLLEDNTKRDNNLALNKPMVRKAAASFLTSINKDIHFDSNEIINNIKSEKPRVEQATQTFASLKKRKTEIIDKAIDSCNNENPEIANQALLEKVTLLEQEIKDQRKEFTQMFATFLEAQRKLQNTIEYHNFLIKEHAIKLDIAEEEMIELKKALLDKNTNFDTTDLNEILPFLSDLKIIATNHQLEMQQEAEINSMTPYKKTFYKTVQQDLNSVYLAMMTVNSGIVEHNKTNTIGSVGNILKIAGYYLPTVGGVVCFLGAILSCLSKSQNEKQIKTFIQIAVNVTEMEKISKDIALKLTQDGFSQSTLNNNSNIKKFINTVLDYIQKDNANNVKYSATQIAQDSLHTEETLLQKQAEQQAHTISAFIIKKIFAGGLKQFSEETNIPEILVKSVSEHFYIDSATNQQDEAPTDTIIDPAYNNDDIDSKLAGCASDDAHHEDI